MVINIFQNYAWIYHYARFVAPCVQREDLWRYKSSVVVSIEK